MLEARKKQAVILPLLLLLENDAEGRWLKHCDNFPNGSSGCLKRHGKVYRFWSRAERSVLSGRIEYIANLTCIMAFQKVGRTGWNVITGIPAGGNGTFGQPTALRSYFFRTWQHRNPALKIMAKQDSRLARASFLPGVFFLILDLQKGPRVLFMCQYCLV